MVYLDIKYRRNSVNCQKELNKQRASSKEFNVYGDGCFNRFVPVYVANRQQRPQSQSQRNPKQRDFYCKEQPFNDPCYIYGVEEEFKHQLFPGGSIYDSSHELFSSIRVWCIKELRWG